MIAVFMVNGTYTYPTALNIFSLVIFSITFAAQMLSFRTAPLFPLSPQLSSLTS
jgi:hypothetical protein